MLGERVLIATRTFPLPPSFRGQMSLKHIFSLQKKKLRLPGKIGNYLASLTKKKSRSKKIVDVISCNGSRPLLLHFFFVNKGGKGELADSEMKREDRHTGRGQHLSRYRIPWPLGQKNELFLAFLRVVFFCSVVVHVGSHF